MIPGGTKGVEIALRLHYAQFQAGLAAAGTQMRTFGAAVNKDLENPKKNLGALGTAGLVAGTAVAAGFGLAAKQAIDFESAFAGVRKTVDGTPEQLSAIRDGIIAMSRELPASREEIAGVAEAAGQLGIQTDSILGFTRVMIDLGESTNISAQDAAISLARLANVMQMPESEFGRLGSTIVELGNNLETSESEIVEFGTRLAGAGQLAGLTEANVLSIGAALSSLGEHAESGGTATQRVLLEITKAVSTGSDNLEVFATTAGMSAEQFAEAWRADPMSAFLAFVEGLGAAGDGALLVLEKLGLQDARLTKAFLAMAGAGDKLRESVEMGTQAWAENTALTEEAAQRYETTESKLRMLGNQVAEVGLQVGEVLLPALSAVADVTMSVVGGFSAMPGPLKLAAGGLVAVVGASAGIAGVAIKVAELKDRLSNAGVAAGFLARNMKTVVIAGAGIGAVVVALVAANAAIEAIARRAADGRFGKFADDTDRVETALRELGTTGRVIGIFAEDLDALAEGFRNAGDAGGGWIGTVTRMGVAAASGSWIGGWATEVHLSGKATEEFEKQIGAVEAKLIELHSVDPDLAATAYKNLAAELVMMGLTVEEVDERFAGYRVRVSDAEQATTGARPGVAGLEDALQDLGSQAGDTKDELLELVDAAQSVFDADMALASASRSVEDAQQRVADGGRELNRLAKERRDAQMGVIEAQRGVERVLRDIDGAARDAEKAQLDLVDAQAGVARIEREMAGAARENRVAQLDLADARRAVEDVQRRIVGLVRDEHIAKLDVIDAEKALRKLQEDQKNAPRDLRSAELDVEEARLALVDAERSRYQGKTAQERKKAQIDYERAQMRVADAEQRLTRLRRDQAEGSTELARAEYRLVDARDAVNNAGDRAIELAVEHERAQMRVIDAEAALADQQRIGEERARALQRAQMGVADAQDRVAAVAQAAADRAWELSRAQDAVRDASDRVNEVNRRGAELARDRARAGQDLQEAMVDEALAAVELAIKQREANGETVTGAEKARLMMDAIDNLIPRIGTDSPMGRRLMEWRDQLASHITPAMQAATEGLRYLRDEAGRVMAMSEWDTMGGYMAMAGHVRPNWPGMAAGGLTRPRSVYRVHDTSEPEIYQQSDGTSLLLTGASAGYITPASKMLTAQQADVMSRRHGGGGGLDVDRLGTVIGEQVAQQMAIAAPAGHKGDLTAIVQLDRREIARAVFRDSRERGG